MVKLTRRAMMSSSALCLLVSFNLRTFATPVSAEEADETVGSSVQFSTHQYGTKTGQALYLNLIVDPSAGFEGKRPVILFSFGGGWEGGDRGDETSVTMWTHFLSLGYAVVAIDYRLGIKEAKKRGEFTNENGTEMYLRAIEWGVEDLFDATTFIVARADEWNLDAKRIVIIGGSSGATNSLVAEYNVANATRLAQYHLPSGFRYAGVISMAGAFWLPAGTPLAFASKPAPIMFFHGGKDWLVTYDEVQDRFSGYGPQYYLREFPGPDFPKWFVDYPEGDHILAALPLLTRQLEIQAFLERMVRDREELSIHTIEHSKVPSTFEGITQQKAAEGGK
ncbi:alpha/beta hydrolase family protein [Agrobacterium pusense]|uniref:alpha/beta hydrolase family protein n=1 Tax=Agrobacterium pusense TaxID=648995 RepID=UPI003FD4130A